MGLSEGSEFFGVEFSGSGGWVLSSRRSREGLCAGDCGLEDAEWRDLSFRKAHAAIYVGWLETFQFLRLRGEETMFIQHTS